MASSSRVVLFLIDGLRPDGLTQADTPTIDALMDAGAHTLTGRTVMPSVTLPCHVSLFLGCRPERHGITTNTWTPQVRPVPGLIELIHQAGHTTASFYNWEPLRDLSPPGRLNGSVFMKNCHRASGDREIADVASHWLKRHDTTFAFVYFGYTDIAGHDSGWMSAPYLDAIANADRCVGAVLDVLPPDCTVLVTSDHGGHEQTHGTDCDEDMTIPFVIKGPGIPAGARIERPLEITDMAPTVARLLGMDAPTDWIGEAVAWS